MGAMKELFIEIQNEKVEWIRNELDDPEADESTPGWFDYEDQFYDLKISQLAESQLAWYAEQTKQSLFEALQADLNQLRELLTPGVVAVGFQTPLYKMAYAHAVTLLETFLADSIKSLVLSSDFYLKKALEEVDFLKKKELSLSLLEVWSQPDGVRGIVQEKLSEVLYHNIPKVKKVLESLIGFQLNIEISHVTQIVSIRHDIAHRNGKTRDGKDIEIDADLVNDAIQQIELFASSVNNALEELPF